MNYISEYFLKFNVSRFIIIGYKLLSLIYSYFSFGCRSRLLAISACLISRVLDLLTLLKLSWKSFKPIPYEIKSTAPNLRPQQIYKPMQSSSHSESYLSKSKSVRRDCIWNGKIHVSHSRYLIKNLKLKLNMRCAMGIHMICAKNKSEVVILFTTGE